MESDIQTKVLACLRGTGAEFETAAPGRAEEFVRHLSEAYASLLAARRRLPEAAGAAHGSKLPVDRYNVTWRLLWEAVNSMTAAWALLERAYAREPLVVARHAMEKVACAIVLFDNPALLAGFVAGKLGSSFATRCISPVRRVARDFGHSYERLNQFDAHVAPDVLLPIAPVDAPEEASMVALAGDSRDDRPAPGYWTEVADLFCAIARDILKPAAENVFFRTRRTAVLEE